MTKAELIEKIYVKAALPNKTKAEEALDAVLSTIKDALASGDSVTFTGFGTFKISERSERKGRNPRSGEEITIPSCKVVKFTPGKTLKEAVN